MSILLKTLRIFGFRGIKELEIDLEPVTVLTGMNNTGKTTILKALQIVLSNRLFISQDDFYIPRNPSKSPIIIDIKIVPLNSEGKITTSFSDAWEEVFTTEKIRGVGNEFVPIRTIVEFDERTHTFKTKQYTLKQWYPRQEGEVFWYQQDPGTEKPFNIVEFPFYYMEAQRDIIEDMKSKTSYLGKMISNIKYQDSDIQDIEHRIKELNEKTVSSSEILSTIKSTLKDLNTALDTHGGVDITPFTKKVRDLNKGLSIHYADNKESFSMEYHGMGTRSWSSLLTLKAFISIQKQNPYFPILAIEEPEAHLHPNAQKKLYSQINSIAGQKIISTHSPYIAACAELKEIRNFYKENDTIFCGKIELSKLSSDGEDERKIRQKVIAMRGELFFSKAIVFFEGETEEQALPIFAEKYFGKPAYELGIDFIGVGGAGAYYPFLVFAENLKIPWFIFSDGEENTVKKVQSSLKKIYNDEQLQIKNQSNVFVLENGCDFEKYLIENQYIAEIQLAFEKLHSPDYLEKQIKNEDGKKSGRTKTVEVCEKCNQNIYIDNIRDYLGEEGYKRALYDCMTSQKTKFSPIIAQTIIDGPKGLPQKVVALFDSIKETLKNKE